MEQKIEKSLAGGRLAGGRLAGRRPTSQQEQAEALMKAIQSNNLELIKESLSQIDHVNFMIEENINNVRTKAPLLHYLIQKFKSDYKYEIISLILQSGKLNPKFTSDSNFVLQLPSFVNTPSIYRTTSFTNLAFPDQSAQPLAVYNDFSESNPTTEIFMQEEIVEHKNKKLASHQLASKPKPFSSNSNIIWNKTTKHEKNEIFTNKKLVDCLCEAVKLDEYLYTHINSLGVENINEQNSLGMSALHIAILYNKQSAIEELMQYKIDLNVRTTEGKTPLHIAVATGNFYLVNYLFNKKVIAQLPINNGQIALHIAIEELDSSTACVMLKELLKNENYNINQIDSTGKTPLLVAVIKNKLEVIKLLISIDAKIDVRDIFNFNEIDYAAKNQNWDILKYLLDKHNFNITKEFKRLLCQPYEEKTNIYSAIASLDVKEKIDDETKISKTLLHIAAENDNIELANFYLKNSIGITYTHDTESGIESVSAVALQLATTGETALHIAAKKGNHSIVEIILNFLKEQKNTNYIDLKDNEGNSAILLAAKANNEKSINLLFEYKANLFITDKEYNSILNYALQNSNKIVSKKLKKYLSSFSKNNIRNENILHFLAKGKDGKFSIEFARELNATLFNELIISPTIIIDNKKLYPNEYPIFYAIKYHNYSFSTFLLSKHDKVTKILNYQGQTILHKAALNNNYDILETILNKIELEFNEKNELIEFIDKKDIASNTALYYAVYKGEVKIIDFLLSAGAQVNIKNTGDKNIFHIACLNGNLEVIENLIECVNKIKTQANISITETSLSYLLNSRDEHGKSAIYYAAVNGDASLVNYLFDQIGVAEENKSNYALSHEDGPLLALVLNDEFFYKVDPISNKNIIHIAIDKKSLSIMQSLRNYAQLSPENFYILLTQNIIEKGKLLDPLTYVFEKYISSIKNEDYTIEINDHRKYQNILLLLIRFMHKNRNIIENSIADLPFSFINLSMIDVDIIEPIRKHNSNNDNSHCLPIENEGIDKLVEREEHLSLLNTSFVEWLDSKKRTPLHIFVIKSDIIAIKNILKHINLNSDKDKASSIIYKLLSQTDNNGLSALDYAISMGNIEIIDYLIHEGSPINLATRIQDGKTLLHFLASLEDFDYLLHVLSILSETSPDLLSDYVNAQDSNGNTALHYVIPSGNDEAISFLLLKNASLKVSNNDNNNPLQLLPNVTPSGKTKLHYAVIANDSDILNDTITKYSKLLNKTDSFGDTALHLALKGEQISIAKQLIASGANLEIANKNKKSASSIIIDKNLEDQLLSDIAISLSFK
jgi:ankyrin repeat protein